MIDVYYSADEYSQDLLDRLESNVKSNRTDIDLLSIAKRQPLRVVFCDVSFENIPAKINVSEIFKLLAQDTGVKIIKGEKFYD